MIDGIGMMDNTISLKFISNLESALADRPKVYQEIKALFKLPTDIQSHDKIEVAKFIHLLQLIIQDYGIADIGFRLGQQYSPAQMGVLGLYLQTCDTLKDAINHYLEYSYLDAEFEAPLQLENHIYTFSIILSPPNELHAIQETYMIICANRIIKTIQYFCAPDVLPLQIIANIFDKKVTIHETVNIVNSPNNTITLTYSNNFLNRKLPGRNPALNKLLKQEVENQVIESRTVKDTVSAVIQQVAKSKHLATLNLSIISRNLAMSERTLSRKLKNEHAQLKDILIHAKRNKAIRELCTGGEITDIAENMGFSDRSSFERAFKTWTAFTPAHFKELNITTPCMSQQNSITSVECLPAISRTFDNLHSVKYTKKDITNIIVKDPILTAKIYGLSHLAFYNAFQSGSIKQSLDYLYQNNLTKGMCHTIVSNSVTESLPFKGINIEEHWVEVFIMAEFCQEVASQGLLNSDWSEDEAYLLGLTGLIGFIFLARTQKENMFKVFEIYDINKFDSVSFSKSLEEYCGISDFMAGALLMAHWGFPVKFIQVLVNMNQPSTKHENQDIINLLRCADEISYYITKENEDMIINILDTYSQNSDIDLNLLTKIYTVLKKQHKTLTNNHNFN